MSDSSIDDFFCWLANYPEETRNSFIDVLTEFFTKKVLTAVGPVFEELQRERDEARSDAVEMAKILKELSDASEGSALLLEEGANRVEELAANWRKASRLAAKIATKWQDEVYQPGAIASLLTAMTPPEISRLCKKGAVRSRNPSGHGRRREVHLLDLINELRKRESKRKST